MLDFDRRFGGSPDDPRTLVVVFLRGGADGLTLVPPLGDDEYHRARPRLRVGEREGVRLDDRFGLHPRLAPLAAHFQTGELAIVHAVGSEDDTRSHFEAQDLMEHAGPTAGGWLGRFLRYRPGRPGASLSAVALGTGLPESLRGAPAASVLRSLDDYSLGDDAAPLLRELAALYGAGADARAVALGGALGRAGRETVAALRRIEHLRGRRYEPGGGASYPDDEFGRGLMEVARLIKARVGLEAASIDLGGWDSHFAQQTLIEPLMTRLAGGLTAFHADLGAMMAATTVVVMTEFGRRVAENASLGTDHGRGSIMMVLGGGVRGGRVLGSWPGLDVGRLEGPGDVPVAVNYRDVLAPVLLAHAPGADLGRVFPDFALSPMGLYG
jgi:uncharacterized protein (DUF1501 family)